MNVQFEGDKVIMDKADFMNLIGGKEVKAIEVASEPQKFTSDFDEATNYLDQLGFKRNLKGFNFLRYAIIEAIKNPKIMSCITKELYPGIANEFNDTPPRVERAIRHSIEVVWGQGDVETLSKIFGQVINKYTGKPTNSELIAFIADEIRIKKQRG